MTPVLPDDTPVDEVPVRAAGHAHAVGGAGLERAGRAAAVPRNEGPVVAGLPAATVRPPRREGAWCHTITTAPLDAVPLSARAMAGEAELRAVAPQPSRRRRVMVPVS